MCNDTEYVKRLIRGANIPLQKYIKKNVLYAFIIMNIKLSYEYFIIKFRYTDDILGRIKTLQDEYKSKIFLIGIKLININTK